MAKDDAEREKTGGDSTSLSNFEGGWRREADSITPCFCGGEAGGVLRPVTGLGPGEQTGMCLLGMAVGVPLEDVFRVRCGGGVDVRLVIAGALATIVAIIQTS